MEKSSRFVKILTGNKVLFEGPLRTLNGKFYKFPEDWTEDRMLEHTQEWSEKNNWTVEVNWLH